MIVLTAVAVILVWVLYRLNQDVCKYWEKRGVPYITATPIFSKNILESFLTTPGKIAEIYKKAAGKDYIGFFLFRTPTLMVCSPKIIHGILYEDFYNFSANRKPECVREDDPLSQHLLALQGQKWKDLRSKITPAFTSGKLKGMYQLIDGRADEFLQILEDREGESIDAEQFCSHFSVASIITCAFGLDAKCMDSGNDKFVKVGRSAFEAGFWKAIKVQLKMLHPAIFNFFRFGGYSKENGNFCANFINEVIEYRRATGYTRPDYVDILMKIQRELNEKSEDNEESNEELSDGLITAQVFSFLVAGYETTTTTLCCTLYELAKNPQIVEQVRAEALSTLGTSGSFNYEVVMRMESLDCVIKEALRIHPPVIFLPRVCTKTTFLPGTSLVIEEGTQLLIPVLNLHRDPQYISDPEKYMPERFSTEGKFALPEVPYMPFSEGPRKCLGMRFALLELKIILAKIIVAFDFELDKNTSAQLTLEEYSRTYKIKDKINIIFTKRKSVRWH